ncbi:MAG: HAD family hydrolase [Proteobacteria bacterium]|nr:HAD family hydrolase [Pseudomonadota bacterium]
MPDRVRAVSLDLDNTLWDTPPVLVRAEAVLSAWLARHAPAMAARFDAGALAALRAAVAAESPERAHDLSYLRTEALRRAARACGYPEAVAERAFGVFLGARNEVVPYAEVPAALARLAARVPLYALSNGNACVWRAGLGRHFHAAIDAATAGAAKPDPRSFAHLVAVAGLAPGAILHVGDDPVADVAGARAAGLQTVWINRTAAPWPDGLARADVEVADLVELERAVGAWLG